MKSNANRPYRVYRVINDEVWGVEWTRVRYFDTKEEAVSFRDKPRQTNAFNAKYVIVHVSKEEAFAEDMNNRLNKWKEYQEKLIKRARKMADNEVSHHGGVRYNTRCSAHGFITGATRIA